MEEKLFSPAMKVQREIFSFVATKHYLIKPKTNMLNMHVTGNVKCFATYLQYSLL